MKTCVVHLVWRPLGLKYFERFLASYKRWPGGHEHTLTVLYNGFESERELAPYRDLLRGVEDAVEHRSIVLPGAHQDIVAYLEAARRCPCDLLCFLNSYSELLDEGWLAKLYSHATRPGVGLVGASGSYESHSCDSAPRLRRATSGSPLWRARTHFYVARHYLGERRAWERERARHEPFPNPHLRTNGWMIARDTLLSLEVGGVKTKEDALAFESGKASLSRQVLARGLQVLVVGRDGQGYAPPEWFHSRTFRSGEQQNLLVSDNRTQQFAQANAQDRAILSRLAWGEQAERESEAQGAS